MTPSAAPSAPVARPAVDPPPHALLWDLAAAAAVSRCVHVVAELGVADALDVDGMAVEDLAARVDLDPDALARVLRALAVHGVFAVDLPHVGHTDASLLLRRDHPMSMGAFAHMMGLPMSWDALTRLGSTVRTGRAGILDLHPQGLFAYLHDHPDEAHVFDRAMTAKSHADIPHILAAHDFAAHRTIADVGGGRGHLLQAIVQRHPGVDATLVDLPPVVDRVRDEPALAGVRLTTADFFTDALPAADAYVLMEILHDWDDDDAVRILSNIRAGAPDHAVVLIIETVLDAGRRRDPAATLDVVMLALTGGRERTPAQFDALIRRAGFELEQVVPTPGGVQVVEARVAPGS
jgi:C-methyltransferase